MMPLHWLCLLLTLSLTNLAWAQTPSAVPPKSTAPLPTVIAAFPTAAAELIPNAIPTASALPYVAAPVGIVPSSTEAASVANEAAAQLTSIPLGKGLPVVVRAGVYFADVSTIDDNEGTFGATIDLRLRWQDLRLHYPPTEAPSGFKEFRGQHAEEQLSAIWSPELQLENLAGEPSFERKGLRLYPDGMVELLIRTTGNFAASFDVENFPFDSQKLVVKVVSERDTQDKVSLDFRQNELDFSTLAPEAQVDGWTLGLVDIRRAVAHGWYGQSYAKIEVSLGAARHPGGSVAAIFIPLLASLLIPLLAMWLNKLENAEFQVEAFELTNIIIGGLFAVIALNFTVNAEYTMLSGDNTVSRLFVLNYVTLGVSLLINLLLFRFNLVARWFSKYVQEQLYIFLVWAVPLLVTITVFAVLLSALT
jgi:hypothetical protein